MPRCEFYHLHVLTTLSFDAATVLCVIELFRFRRCRTTKDEVIDLGAPRRVRRPPRAARPPRALSPSARLPVSPIVPRAPDRPLAGRCPGPPRPQPKRVQACRRTRTTSRPVPNARLYRPPPPVRRPPPPVPRVSWPPPAARSPHTASRAALQLSERRAASGPPPATSRRLVVALPVVAGGGPGGGPGALGPPARAMEGADLDDGSDGNDPLSAPSEFLAEFLSAIMQRQYAEALKYCRLILQYEPHNATARGFYPLLQHKVNEVAQPSSAAAGTPASFAGEARRRRSSSPDSAGPELMEQGADESETASSRSRSRSPSGDSCASQSSLEPDSSGSAERSDSASAGWESVGTAGSSGEGARAPHDDNGNAAPASPEPSPTGGLHTDDLQNDNDQPALHKGELSAATLRRLRAQFACSIK